MPSLPRTREGFLLAIPAAHELLHVDREISNLLFPRGGQSVEPLHIKHRFQDVVDNHDVLDALVIFIIEAEF